MAQGNSFVFLYKAVLFGVATVVVIPREVYKKYFIYGFIFGGIGETLTAFVFEKILHLIAYKNMGIFNFLGLYSFWTPIAWTFSFMLFFYFLPREKIFRYLYIAGFTFFAYGVGQVLQNLGLFEYIGIQKYLAPVVFLVWFLLAAWLFLKLERSKNM
ncbi:MAG: hypothetical protein ACYCX4_06435 [Bacillota bacterium]